MAKAWEKLFGELLYELFIIFAAVYVAFYINKYAPITDSGKYPLLLVIIILITLAIISKTISKRR